MNFKKILIAILGGLGAIALITMIAGLSKDAAHKNELAKVAEEKYKTQNVEFKSKQLAARTPFLLALEKAGTKFEQNGFTELADLKADPGSLGYVGHYSDDLGQFDTSCRVQIYDTVKNAKVANQVSGLQGRVYKVPKQKIAVIIQDATYGTKCTKSLQIVLKQSKVGLKKPAKPNQLVEKLMEGSSWQKDKVALTNPVKGALGDYFYLDSSGNVQCTAWFFDSPKNRKNFDTSFSPFPWMTWWDIKFSSQTLSVVVLSEKGDECLDDMGFQLEDIATF